MNIENTETLDDILMMWMLAFCSHIRHLYFSSYITLDILEEDYLHIFTILLLITPCSFFMSLE
jgi:hypothetical protein